MRLVRSALAAVFALGVSACASSSPRAPLPPPPYGQTPAYAPQPGQLPQAGAPATAPFGLALPAFPALPALPTLPTIEWPVNVAALMSLQGKIRCAPEEVAPGTWVTFDCGAGRPVSRAIAFVPPMSLNSSPLPAAVDHRLEGMEGPVKSQGAVGACTAFSLSTAMDHGVRRMGRSDVIAPLHVWAQYAVPMMGVAGDETVDKNITLEPTWPYDPAKACKMMRASHDSCEQAYGVKSGSGDVDPKLRAERSMADANGRYRVTAIERLSTQPANLHELSAVLAGGDDVWASFWLDSRAWKASSLKGGVIPDYSVTSDTGHAVVLSGYRTLPDGKKQFLIHNSWGSRWGEQGYGWISEAMVVQYMRSAYKVRVSDASGHGPMPAPGGGGECPQGQVKDSVLGSCASLCPSGSPPAAGVCLPSVPGFPAPGPLPFPIPSLPGAPEQQRSACPAGQAPDLMTGQCTGLCPGGVPAIGGMCMPLGR